MKKEYFVSPPGVYPPFGYTHAIKAGNMILVAGKTGRNLERKVVDGGFTAQATQTLENIKNTLKAAGATMDDVVSITIFFTNLDDVTTFHEITPRFFKNLPTMTGVQVTRLAAGVVVEIQAIAVIDS